MNALRVASTVVVAVANDSAFGTVAAAYVWVLTWVARASAIIGVFFVVVGNPLRFDMAAGAFVAEPPETPAVPTVADWSDRFSEWGELSAALVTRAPGSGRLRKFTIDAVCCGGTDASCIELFNDGRVRPTTVGVC